MTARSNIARKTAHAWGIAGLLGVAPIAEAWAIDPAPGGPYAVDAGQGVTLDASDTWMSWACILSQAVLSTAPTEGVQFRWDLNADGAYDLGWLSTGTAPFSAIGLDGPVVVPVGLQVRCYAHTGLPPYDATGWYIDEATTAVNVTVRNVAPVAGAVTVLDGLDRNALPDGANVRFRVAFTDVEAADTHTFRWAWSDGSITTGNPTTRTFGPGAGSVTVTVSDDDGGTGSTQTTFSVADSPPVLTRFDVPDEANEGDVVVFSAAATDGSDDLVYTWTVSDGTVLQGAEVSWTAAADGEFTVDLVVSDGAFEVEASAGIDVNNLPPVVTRLSHAAELPEGVALSFAAEASDPGDDPLSYVWSAPGATLVSGAGTATTSWRFPDNGSYTVSVTVADDAGASDTFEETVSVSNVAPAPAQIDVPATAEEGTTVAFHASFLDVAADPLTYTWTFNGLLPQVGASVSRVFSDGQVQVGLRVDDGDGGVWTGSWVLTVSDLPPSVVDLDVPTSLMEGEQYAFTVTTDDAGGDEIEVTWTLGDGTVSVGSSVLHAYLDEGTYQGSVVVDDGVSSPVTLPFVVGVQNVAPVLTALLPSRVDEGEELELTASATDAGTLDQLSYAWFVDGIQAATGRSFAPTFDDDGDHTLRVVVRDQDGGSDDVEGVLTVDNVAPAVVLAGAVNDAGGQPLGWSVQVIDPGADTFRFDWDFGDGTLQADGGPSQQHSYASNGERTVRVVVTDDDGGVGQDQLSIEITQLGPRIDTFVVPGSAEEGHALTMSCTGVDGGSTGTLTTSWTFGDGGVGSSSPVTHAWDDDGAYTVTCVLVNGDGREARRTAQVQVANAPPVITGTPSTSVIEGSTYVFTPGVTDPGVDDTHTWALINAPAGATLVPGTGQVTWASTIGELGSVSFSLAVQDDDGGRDGLVWAVEVQIADGDGDGMSDHWEVDNSLDPGNAADAEEDPDGDGRTNLQEYLDDTDPRSDDRPGVPVLVSPVGGERVPSARPRLLVGPANSPAGDVLFYEVVVYEGPVATTPIWQRANLIGAQGVAVLMGLDLTENETYWWTARASDGFGEGPWADRETFVINGVEEAPDAPTLSWPRDGATVDSTAPLLEVLPSSDPDGDELSYEIVVTTALGIEVREATGLLEQGGVVSWSIDPAVVDGAELCWSAVAVDEVGLRSPPSEVWCFVVDVTNLAPSSPIFVRPVDGAVVADRAVVLQVDNGVDPEGRTTFLTAELDTEPTFDSSVLQRIERLSDPSGRTSWSPDLLKEDTWYHARALTSDGAADSPWATITFFVNEANDPPGVPVLIAPEDGAELSGTATLVVGGPADPEGLPVTLIFEVQDAAGLVVATTSGVEVVGDSTAWTTTALPKGIYSWRARGVDSEGLEGDWSDPWTFRVVGVDELPNSRTVPDLTGPEVEEILLGCRCDSGGSGGGLFLLVLALIPLRRRR